MCWKDGNTRELLHKTTKIEEINWNAGDHGECSWIKLQWLSWGSTQTRCAIQVCCQLSFHSKTKPYIPPLCTAMIMESCSNSEISKFFLEVYQHTCNLNCNCLRALVLLSVAQSSLLKLLLLQCSCMNKLPCSSLLLPWHSAWEWAQPLCMDLITQNFSNQGCSSKVCLIFCFKRTLRITQLHLSFSFPKSQSASKMLTSFKELSNN